MKIALIIEYLDAARGGAEQFTVWLAHAMVGAGHDVHVVCHTAGNGRNPASPDLGEATEATGAADVPLEGLHVHALGGLRLCSAVGFRLFGWRAAHWCHGHQPDVVHSMTVAFPGDVYQPHAGVYAEIQIQAIASRRRAAGAAFKRLLLRLNGKQRTLLALEAQALRPRSRGGPGIVLSLSPLLTRHLSKHYQVETGSEGRLIELPDPQFKTPPAPGDPATCDARAAFRRRHNIDEGDRVALFAGHDFRRKGLRFAIEAIARTRAWKLLVVGRGGTAEYQRIAESLGLGSRQPRVLFLGPALDMERVYAAADALILPTFYDSFGLVASEALARGLPVISTEFLGAAYLIRQFQAGAIVDSPEETGHMAAALEALPAPGNPAHEQLAARARMAGASMPPEKYLAKLLAIYDHVLQRKAVLTGAALSPQPAGWTSTSALSS